MDYPDIGRFEGYDITKYSIALDTGRAPNRSVELVLSK